MYVPAWFLILFLLYLVWQARQPRPTMAEYREEQEARQRQRNARREVRRQRRAETQRLLQMQRQYALAILHAHPWHTTIFLLLIASAGLLFWSLPPRINRRNEPVWQVLPIGLSVAMLMIYLWRFGAFAREARHENGVHEGTNADEGAYRRQPAWGTIWGIVFAVACLGWLLVLMTAP